jgi:hypothetical protein
MRARLFLNGKGLVPSGEETRRLKKVRAIILVVGTLAALGAALQFSVVSETAAPPGGAASGASPLGDPGLLFEAGGAPIAAPASAPALDRASPAPGPAAEGAPPPAPKSPPAPPEAAPDSGAGLKAGLFGAFSVVFFAARGC